MKAYGDRVLARKIEKQSETLATAGTSDTIDLEVVSVGHIVHENDELKVGDTIKVKKDAYNTSFVHDNETLYLYRKLEILVIN